MPSIPIWSVAILIASVICIIGCLLYHLIRCRHFTRSTNNQAEYSDKKQAQFTLGTKSSINAASLSIPPSNSQPSILSSNHLDQKQSPPPFRDISLFANQMELGSVEANHTVSPSQSNSTSKSNTPNDNNIAPFHLSGTTNTIPQQVTSTIKSILHHPRNRQKPHARQLFDLSANQSFDNNEFDTDSTTSLPLPLPPKDDLPLPSTPVPENVSSHLPPPNLEDKPIPPSPNSLRQMDQDRNQEDSGVCLSLPIPGTHTKDTIDVESESRQELAHNLDSMFAWSTSDDEEDDADDTNDRHSIDSIFHQNDNNIDIKSVTSGSVHRLVRDSTVLDADHRSLAARSIVSSVRVSLHDMESWWPVQDNSTDHAQYSQSNVVPTCESTNSCCPSSEVFDNFTPTPTYSRITLNTSTISLANEDQDQGSESTEQSPSPVSQSPPTESLHTNALENEGTPTSPISLNHDKEYGPTINTKPIPAISSTMSKPSKNKVDSSSVPARAKSLPFKQASPRNSASIGPSRSSKIDSVRQELQATWNAHRLSEKGSWPNGSTRSSISPPSSVSSSTNPRQLNQHLVSIAIQGNKRPKQQQQQQHIQYPKPSLLNGNINEEWLVQSASIEDNHSPQPTVSFSSSTVRTMIPENEFHIDRKDIITSSQQKTQPQGKQAPGTQKQKQKQPRKKTATPKDQGQGEGKESSLGFGTVRVNRQQRGSIPWSSNDMTNAKASNKTPAQYERDRYLQLIKE